MMISYAILHWIQTAQAGIQRSTEIAGLKMPENPAFHDVVARAAAKSTVIPNLFLNS
jgi:hypothetical protein